MFSSVARMGDLSSEDNTLNKSSDGIRLRSLRFPAHLRQTIWITVALTFAIAVVMYGFFADNLPISIGYLGTAKPLLILEPIWFIGLAALPVLFAISLHSLTDISVGQVIISTVLRGVIISGLFIALARPVWSTSSTRKAIVVLVDVSKSIDDKQLAAATNYLSSLRSELNSGDKLSTITFSEKPRRQPDNVESFARHEGEGEATDIQSAIRLAYTAFPEGYLPEILLISDGNETLGNSLSEVSRANDLGVRISRISFPKEPRPEIRLTEIKLPSAIREGAPFVVRGKVFSTQEQSIEVALSKDGSRLEKKNFEIGKGVNWVDFKTVVPKSGFANFKMKVVAETGDTEPNNNIATVAAAVNGRPRILYAEGSSSRNGQRAALTRALEAENFRVDERGPRGIPSNIAELQNYDLVLISDIPEKFIGVAQMNALNTYVRKNGGSLLMSGGEDSFGSGGFQGSTLERMMPVRFDSETTREQPNVAIMMVIDRSGSMSGPKIEAAKESARATVEVLSPTDMVGVIAFDNSPVSVVRLQRAANRGRISTDIARLTASGGTNILPALNEAYETLLTANARVKHVILLSDGQAPYDGISGLTREMRSANITVSAVGIGDADRNLLQMISSEGNGRLYMVEDIAALPRIFMKETTEAKKSALVEDRIRARIVKRADLIEGTGVGNAPSLRGYVSTKAKPTADVILASDLGEPLLARWRLGAGQTVAWTSDVKNRWAVEWLRWPNFAKFWAQVVRASMRNKVHQSFDLSVKVAGDQTQVVVDAIDPNGGFINGLDSELQIMSPEDGQKVIRRVPMQQTGPGRYATDFDVETYGAYRLKVVQKRENKVVAETLGAAALSYPQEYVQTSINEPFLTSISTATNGLADPTPGELAAESSNSITFREELWPWIMLILAGLLLVDTYLKRVRLFGFRNQRI